MRRYRVAIYIPETMTPPSGSPVSITASQRARSINACARLPEELAIASSGMATVDVTIRNVTRPLDAGYYRLIDAGGAYDGYWPEAGYIAQSYGEQTAYDAWMVITPNSMKGAGTINVRGLSIVNTAWVSSSYPALAQVLLHELMHLIGVHVQLTNGMTDGWPTCPENEGIPTGLHCAVSRGFIDVSDPRWLHQFGSGLVDGNLGFTADKWAVETPTEQVLRTLPRPGRIASSHWGSMGAIVVPSVPDP